MEGAPDYEQDDLPAVPAPGGSSPVLADERDEVLVQVA
jgi:hypothetical protein